MVAPERYSVAIKEMPTAERPRERLLACGPQALSTAELLAIVLRTGTARESALALAGRLLSENGGLRGVANTGVADLCRTRGIGTAKGVEIAACVELGKRLAAHADDPRPAISSPEDAANLFRARLADPRREHFLAALLDTKNRLLKTAVVSVGSLDASIVHPREVFKEAVSASAASIIVSHNHPSGDPAPSAEDRQVTLRLVEAGRVLGIELLDHVVLGDGRWVSMKREGLM